jgi:hypothetical protein
MSTSKKAKSKAQANRRAAPSVVGRLVVLQSEDLKDPMTEVPETASIEGTFDTMERVEQFIRADTHEYFPPESAHEGRNDDQTAPIYICQVMRVVKAVPIVSMRVLIEDAGAPNPSSDDRPNGQGGKHE